jgi:hypothetical protein
VALNFKPLKPLLRPVRDYAVRLRFLAIARHGPMVWPADDPPVFVLGCGRSGTTFLGELLAAHPRVYYLFEPRARWSAVTLATDAAHTYGRRHGHVFLGSESVDPMARVRFARLFGPPSGCVLVEKTPINTLRIEFLDEVVDDARFLYIARDGGDVARSIARRAEHTRRVFGRGMVNDWWGSNDSKWQLMSREGAGRGHFAEEVALLQTAVQRGAYEWLVNMREMDSHRERLRGRMHEVTYRDLTDSPDHVLAGIARFLHVDPEPTWLASAADRVAPPARPDEDDLELPRRMAEQFNVLQSRYGFATRAIIRTAQRATDGEVG